jgi:activator of HSP90 ATPase
LVVSRSSFDGGAVTDKIHHEVSLPAPPDAVYDELVDAARFAAFTGAPAELDAAPGGSFSLFGGQILGRNVELVPGVRVVQAWRVAGWEPGLYSVVRFELEGDDTGTTVHFDHTGFPPEAASELDSGWHAMYWDPMAKHLAAG